MRARIVPVSPIDPGSENVSVALGSNVEGVLHNEIFGAGEFVPNSANTKWLYKIDRGTPRVYRFEIIRKFNTMTQTVEYLAKWYGERDLGAVDPLENTEYTEAELAEVIVQLNVGNDPFIIAASWQRTSKGWYLPDAYFSRN